MESKTNEWLIFSGKVHDHIKDYVISQYGDYPDTMVEDWDLKSIKENLNKYVSRIGTGSRGIEEEIRDAFKIAHYACYLLKKLYEIYKRRN